MLLPKHLINPITNTLLTLLCITLGIYGFGKPVVFDTVSIGAFIIIAYKFRDNIDVKTVCVLLILEYIIVNLAFKILSSNLIYTACMFAITIATLWYCRSDKLSKPIGILLVVALIAEWHWHKVDHPAPQIHFIFFKVSLSLIVRQLLMYRPHGLNYYLNISTSYLRLDWFIYKTLWVACVVECAMISEYIIRHTTDIKALYLYNSYEYIMHALAVWVLWLVLREALKIQRKKSLLA